MHIAFNDFTEAFKQGDKEIAQALKVAFEDISYRDDAIACMVKTWIIHRIFGAEVEKAIQEGEYKQQFP